MEPRTPFEADPAPLGADAQALLRAYRDAHEPPDLVKARVRRRLQEPAVRRGEPWVSLAAAAAAVILILAAAGVLPPRPVAGIVGRSQEVVEAAFAAAASPEAQRVERRGRGGGAAWLPESAEFTAVAASADDPTDDPADDPADAAATGGEAAEAAETAATSGHERRRAKSRIAETSGATIAEAEALDAAGAAEPATPSTLAAEKRLLEAAWRALAVGDDQGALAAIDRHRREHPRGLLSQERAALEVITRCRAAPASAADQRLVAEFAAAHPRSPWLGKVTAACAPADAP